MAEDRNLRILLLAVAPVLLCATASVQRYLAETADLNPWKGGGFGMFAAMPPYRVLRVLVVGSDHKEKTYVTPNSAHFKEEIIQAFYDGIKHKPDTTFGNVKADVIKDKERGFTPGNFCSVIRHSPWKG